MLENLWSEKKSVQSAME